MASGSQAGHIPQPFGDADRHHNPDAGQVALGEVRLVDHGQPDRLEGGQDDRAAHRGDLLQRQVRPVEAGVHQGGAGVDGGHGERDPADVEHGQRGPDPVLRGEEEPGLLGAVREPDQRLVAEQRALRLGRGARRVHDDGRVPHLDQLPPAQQVTVGYFGPGRGEVGLGGETGRGVLAQHHDLAQVRGVGQVQAQAVLAGHGRERRRQQGREVGRTRGGRVGRADEQGPHPGVPDQVGQLQALVAGVDRDRV